MASNLPVTEALDADPQKLLELQALVRGIRERIRLQYPTGPVTVEGTGSPAIRVPVADLMPVVHARDAAQAKMAAIGSVNPRRGGFLNNAIQSGKKTIARSLQWFVRDQVVFNRGALACVEALMESVNELNRSLTSLGAQVGERLEQNRTERDRQDTEIRLADIARLENAFQTRTSEITQSFATEAGKLSLEWPAFQKAQELAHQKLQTSVAERHAETARLISGLQTAFDLRASATEASFRELVKAQHAEFRSELDRQLAAIQQQLWADTAKIRLEYERTIHSELRTIRQRGFPPPSPLPPNAHPEASFDYPAFANRFRGSEEYVRTGAAFYLPYMKDARTVLDLGCGHGEFLEVMRQHNIPACGLDSSPECISLCLAKGLEVQQADLFDYLEAQPDASLPALFCAQVVEHLPPSRLPMLISLCAAKLEHGGVLAIETPNPECLAIFASHFYLDPTHTRPVPSALLAFYLEEAGMGGIEVHPRFPARDTWPELADLPESFVTRFFGGLDYAILARKL